MTKAEILRVVLNATVERDGKKIITCAKALKIADECGKAPGYIGKICDTAGIKIRRCKLGCFK